MKVTKKSFQVLENCLYQEWLEIILKNKKEIKTRHLISIFYYYVKPEQVTVTKRGQLHFRSTTGLLLPVATIQSKFGQLKAANRFDQ